MVPVTVPGIPGTCMGAHTVYSLYRSKGKVLVPGTRVLVLYMIVWPPPTQVKPEPLVVIHDHDCYCLRARQF